MNNHENKRMVAWLIVIVFLSTGLPFNPALIAQDPFGEAVTPIPQAVRVAEPVQAPAATSKPTKRWLLLTCGLPGDDEHRERLTAACQKIIAAAKPVLGVEAENLRVLAGDEEMQVALADKSKEIGVCTKESIIETMQTLGEEVAESDSCWVIVLGHANLYDGRSKYNILDSDIDQSEFAVAAQSINCREQVFWITTPVSGFWIKPLAKHSRVVIAATEADLEFTGTEMPYTLADMLAGESDEPFSDVDQDGVTSLLDLYLAVSLQIHGVFQSMDRLQTEHSQLEDNGDGRGSELQQPYLPVEEEEDAEEEEDDSEDAPKNEPEEVVEDQPKRPVPKPISNSSLDGFRSRQILIVAPQ